jgi:hypothetical protein
MKELDNIKLGSCFRSGVQNVLLSCTLYKQVETKV